jgi:signal transduction histidine kinase
VFEAFFRGTDSPVAAIKGSGLGLSIVRNAVQLHKGRVEILDGPGAPSASASAGAMPDEAAA